MRQGLRFPRAELPSILAKRTDLLSPRMLRIIEGLSGTSRRLDERIKISPTTKQPPKELRDLIGDLPRLNPWPSINSTQEMGALCRSNRIRK